MRFILLTLAFILGVTAHSQEVLNKYKYVIVPKQFSNFKSVNQYQTSTRLKYYLEGYGFNVVYADAIPKDLANQRCLGVKADLKDASNLLKTKVAVVFSDCGEQVVYETKEGVAKEKEYMEAYTNAIRDAVSSLKGFTYAYSPVEEQSKGVKLSPAKMPVDDIAKRPNTDETPEVVEAAEVSKEMLVVSMLYAQPIAQGYQLVDATPKVVLKLLKTSIPNIFIAEGTSTAGIVYTENDSWIFEYYANGLKVKEPLTIKF